jgi:hypothetical protein
MRSFIVKEIGDSLSFYFFLRDRITIYTCIFVSFLLRGLWLGIMLDYDRLIPVNYRSVGESHVSFLYPWSGPAQFALL